MSTTWVKAATGKYPVHVGRGLLAGIGPGLRASGFRGRVAVVSDATVLEDWGPVLLLNLESAGYPPEVLSIVPGEASKTVSTAELFWGRSLASTGKLNAALPHFEKAVQLKPNWPEAQSDLARLKSALAAHP